MSAAPKKKEKKAPPSLDKLAQCAPGESYKHDATSQQYEQAEFKIGASGVEQEGVSVGDPAYNVKDMEFGSLLGTGVSGSVRRARSASGQEFALKQVNIMDKMKRLQIMNELRTLVNCECRHLVRFFTAFLQDRSIFFVLEHMDCGSLLDILAKRKAMPEEVVAGVALHVLTGLNYMHKTLHQMHRDMKPANVLGHSDGVIKLGDFGVSCKVQSSVEMASTFIGTVQYMAPERMIGDDYSFPSDVWSCGLMFMECALGKLPYPTCATALELITTIVEEPSPSPDASKFSPEFKSFIDLSLLKDPSERGTAESLLAHPFLKKYPKCEDALAAWLQGCKSVTPFQPCDNKSLDDALLKLQGVKI